jgi:hypothetical protein
MKRLGTTSLALSAALAALPVSAALFRVWVHHDRVAMSYVLSEAGAKRQELRRQLMQLEVELAAERSPERLSERAAALGLAPASPAQILAGDAVATEGGER